MIHNAGFIRSVLELSGQPSDSHIKVYQKYLVSSIKVSCATRSLYVSSGPKDEGVLSKNQKGQGSGPCSNRGGLDKTRYIAPIALLVRVQRFRNDLYKAVKMQRTREKGGDLRTKSYDKSPYTHRKIQQATLQHKNVTKKL